MLFITGLRLDLILYGLLFVVTLEQKLLLLCSIGFVLSFISSTIFLLSSKFEFFFETLIFEIFEEQFSK